MKTSARLVLVFNLLNFFSFVMLTNAYSKELKGAVCILLLDEGKGNLANDLSENKNNATIEGVPKWVDGKYGSALEFDGVTGCAKVPDSDSLDLTKDITIMAWLKRFGTYPNMGFVTKVTFGTNNRSYELALNNDSPRFGFTTDGTANTWNTVIAKSVVPEKEWTHATGTYDGKTMKVYVNGELSSSKSVALNIFSGNSALALARHGADAQYFKGVIDEVAIFNRALSDSEIKAAMDGIMRLILAVSPQDKLTVTWGKVKNQ